jgi:phosphotransferase system HPr (HPr) family protein
MIKKEVFLVSELGLHARPCGRIATGLSALNLSLAEIYYEDKKANLNSIMELLTICENNSFSKT